MPTPARVLVAGDEPAIVDPLTAALRLSGFDVWAATDATRVVELAATHRPDIVVLDVELGHDGNGSGSDGVDAAHGPALARRLRDEHGGPPVLFLTPAGSVADRVAGLTAGGDDYVTKPFSLETVVLRLRAVLRRTRRPVAPDDGEGRLRYADVTIDEDAHEVRRGARVVELSPTEFNLLRYLMVNAERVVSKAQILDRVWSYEYRGDPRIVESYISYLRRKLDAGAPPLIHTVRGVGYTLRQAARRH